MGYTIGEQQASKRTIANEFFHSVQSGGQHRISSLKECWGFADLQVLLSSWLINLLDTPPPETPGVGCVYCYTKQKPPLGQVTVSKHINL